MTTKSVIHSPYGDIEKIHTVFFDMDEVLVDQVGSLCYLEDITPEEFWNRHEKGKAIHGNGYSYVIELIEKHLHTKKHFISAHARPEFHDFYEIMKELLSKNVHVKILSSGTAQEHLYPEICRQKNQWLDRHNVHMIPRIFTQGSARKKEHAAPGAVLVDDFMRNIVDFKEGGGIGIHHTDPELTFLALKELELIS